MTASTTTGWVADPADPDDASARGPAGAGRHVGRAPRLRPDQNLADSITRVGRFAKIDPLQGRDLPRLIRVVGVVGWAALMAESFRRARAARSSPD